MLLELVPDPISPPAVRSHRQWWRDTYLTARASIPMRGVAISRRSSRQGRHRRVAVVIDRAAYRSQAAGSRSWPSQVNDGKIGGIADFAMKSDANGMPRGGERAPRRGDLKGAGELSAPHRPAEQFSARSCWALVDGQPRQLSLRHCLQLSG